ncbi:hypothetical protein H0H92_004944 [Tricholoma furcatifolium]|nr:hypothetical protein H0H92_004944 [Tricholoma furcatifolium]
MRLSFSPTSILTFVRKLFPMRSYTAEELPDLFRVLLNNPTSVDAYRVTFMNFKTLSDARAMPVTKLSLCKLPVKAQHEFVVVDITYNNHTYRVQAERTALPPTEPSPRHIDASLLLQSLDGSRASSEDSSRSSQLSFGITAVDRFQLLPKQHTEKNAVKRYCIPGNTELFWYHVVILADLVHRNQPTYKLFSHNCYYFAGVVTFIAITTLNQNIEPDRKEPDGVEPGMWRDLVKTFSISGRWLPGLIELRGKYVTEIERAEEERLRHEEERLRHEEDIKAAREEERAKMKRALEWEKRLEERERGLNEREIAIVAREQASMQDK